MLRQRGEPSSAGGIYKQIIQNYLPTNPMVVSFRYMAPSMAYRADGVREVAAKSFSGEFAD